MLDPERIRALAYDAFDSPPDAAVAFLTRLAGEGATPAALDVGCGTGRVLAALEALGWETVGMEPDLAFLERARERLAGRPVRLLAGGLLDLDAREDFDLIAAINGPFSYLLTPAERREALRRCWEALRPGGVLALDQANFLWILQNYRPPQPAEAAADGWRFLRLPAHEIDLHDAVWRHADTVQADGPDGESVHFSQVRAMSLAPGVEIRADLADAGFADIQTWPDLRAEAPGRATGARLVLTARKPAE